MHVAIIYSLPSRRMLATDYSATDEDSSIIARMVARGLAARGMTSDLVVITEDTIGKIREVRADCIFNLIEWCGLDIYLSQQAFFQMRALKIPITGSSEDLFVLTGDKIALKRRLHGLKVSTPRAVFFATGSEPIADHLPYPLLVKPSLEHCSIGLTRESLAHNKKELRAVAQRQIKTFTQPVLAEEFIEGREFLVYLVEETRRVRVLPIEEVVFDRVDPLAFQTYETKWVEGHIDYQTTDVVVANLTASEVAQIEELSLRVFTELGFSGYARFDVRMREGLAYILEANANPSVYDAEYELTNIESEVIPGILFPDYLECIVIAAFTSAGRSRDYF
jgi:D-alanine-D-alanine ligase